MAGFRKIFIAAVSKASSALPTNMLLSLAGQKLVLPFYHAISDVELPHIKHLYQVKGTKVFRQDLEFLLKHFEPINYFDLRELILNNEKPQKPSFLLTFDDGLSSFYHVIAPILKEYCVPAVCFLNSAFIDNKGLFFRYKQSLIIEQLLVKENQSMLSKEFSTYNNVERILGISYEERSLLDKLASAIELDFDQFLRTEQPYLTSTQIQSLINDGFYFGGHSVDHPFYYQIPFNEQLKQTRESMNHVAKSFNLNYRTFSFPFTDYGVTKRFFTELKNQKFTELTFGCAGQKKDILPTHLQRIPFEMAHLTGKQILNSELLYYLIKHPFGKNRIKRA
ncbi:MAG: polysaccharide deacetylase family protein [Bacteroidetes bacterium]|nr:polysaccharide deacetylase family protein [Bacteroidota bacterium]